jgi:protein-S-isoprenylcysteine O-methyltransferase Ste14
MQEAWRWSLVAVLCALAAVRGWARWRAGVGRSLPSPAGEGPLILAARLILAVPVFALSFAHAFVPERVAPLVVPLPDGLRWAGLLVSVAALGLLLWTHRALDRHFSPSVRVDPAQVLVTHGPYRWVRHPMYVTYAALFVGLGLLSADPALGASGLAVMAVLMVARVPREERLLADRFGAAYTAWAARTGRFLPRWRDFGRRG